MRGMRFIFAELIGRKSRKRPLCMVANILRDVWKRDGEERLGTRLLSPGAKAWCSPVLWVDGYESVELVPRHRPSKLYDKISVNFLALENFRYAEIHSPKIRELNQGFWRSKRQLTNFIKLCNQRSQEIKEADKAVSSPTS